MTRYGLLYRPPTATSWPRGFTWTWVKRGYLDSTCSRFDLPETREFPFGVIESPVELSQDDCERWEVRRTS